MNLRVMLPVFAGSLVVGAGVAYLVLMPDSRRVDAPAAIEAPAPAPPPAPDADTPPPETPPAAAPRAARRPPPPPSDTAAPPAPAPAPAVPTTGTVRIESDVPGAQVFIDRRFIGTTPVVAQDVAPGSHQLNVSAEGFESFANPIDVPAGPLEIMIRFREVRLNASLDVVHKHGIGSCRGRLVATPQGLRYESTNKGDEFTSPLLGLETFEVDYLDKNLRVRLRGKQYNFTDPEGNADRLFVFHRDVNNARERLKKGDRPAGE